MIKTGLCSLLGIEYPILQGGMAWVATAELAAAVSQAGGMGIIGAGNAPPEVVRGEIRKAKTLTDKPFGLNIYYMSPYVEDIVEIVAQEGVALVTTGAGNPGKHIEKLKEAGSKVFPVVASVALAKRLERLGVDGFIAEGMECGGHTGDLTTMVLVPQIVDVVGVPVVAAGGMADGRGLMAALALGAVGVQMGTRFVCAAECSAHANYKDAILKAKDRDTVLTGYSGHFVRVIRNRLTREFEKLVSQGASEEELDQLGAGKLQLAAVQGDVDYGSVMAGQIAGLVTQIKPAREIIGEIMEEAEDHLRRVNQALS